MRALSWGTPADVEAVVATRRCLVLRLPVDAESVGIGRRAAARFAEANDFDPEVLRRVRLSVSEAISNVVLHAHGPSDDDRPHLVVRAECEEKGLVVLVCDSGSGMRARDDSPGLGLGLGLMASSCDELAIDPAPGGGTVVRMSFVASGSRVPATMAETSAP